MSQWTYLRTRITNNMRRLHGSLKRTNIDLTIVNVKVLDIALFSTSHVPEELKALVNGRYVQSACFLLVFSLRPRENADVLTAKWLDVAHDTRLLSCSQEFCSFCQHTGSLESFQTYEELDL